MFLEHFVDRLHTHVVLATQVCSLLADPSRHRVRLSHEELGHHELRVGFSEQPIARNLLGRDFFGLFQIGFWESQSRLLFSPEG